MDERFSIEGLTIAPGVIEAIISAAVGQVEGVAQVGAPSISSGIISAFNRRYPVQGILITADDDQRISVAVHTYIYYGYRLHDVADSIRSAVAETLEGQLGVAVDAVDIFVDGIQFPE